MLMEASPVFSGKVSVQRVKFSYRLLICDSIIYVYICTFLHFMQLLVEELLTKTVRV